MRHLGLWIISALSMLLLLACSSGGNSSEDVLPEDGDWIEDEQESDLDQESAETDGDSEENASCVTTGCTDDRYCDTQDGLCKSCTEDNHCSLEGQEPDIFRICQNGHCRSVVCPAILLPTIPEIGVLYTPGRSVETLFDGNGRFFVDRVEVFPIAEKPADDLDKAIDAGYNIVMNTQPCCSQPSEFDAQVSFLQAAQNVKDGRGLYAAVFGVWPPAQAVGGGNASLLNQITERAQIKSLLFWLGTDRIQTTGWMEDLDEALSFLFKVDDAQVLVFNEDSGFSIPTIESKINEAMTLADPDSSSGLSIKSLVLAAVNVDGGDPSSEVKRVLSARPGKPVWARVGFDAQSTTSQLVALSLHALANGATGIVYEPVQSDATQKTLDIARRAARFIRDREVYWLAGSQGLTPSSITPQNQGLALYESNYNNKIHFHLAVNATAQPVSANVGLPYSGDNLPYCRAEATGTEGDLALTREASFAVELGPWEVRVFQTSSANSPGEQP